MRASLLLSIGLAAALCHTLPAQGDEPAIFEVGTRIQVPAPGRFGVNVDLPAFSHWRNFIAVNQWARFNAFEPVLHRFQNVATGGDASTLIDDSASGAHWHDSYRGNWWAGATAVVYRPLPDGSLTLLRSGRIAASDVGPGSPNSLTFADPGPAIQAGDFYQLTAHLLSVPPTRQKSWHDFGFNRYVGGERQAPDDPRVLLAYDDTRPAAGRSSLRVTLTGPDAPAGIFDWWLPRPDRPNVTRIPAGTNRLRFRVSLRQEGLTTDRILIRLGETLRSVEVSAEWSVHQFDFNPADTLPSGANGMLAFLADGPGTFWIDNLSIWDPELPADSILPNVTEALREARPGVIRIWNLVNQGRGGTTLDDALAAPAERSTFLALNQAHAPPDATSLHDMLQLCAEVGADPWIVIGPTFTDAELAGLLEYLAGDASTPYGARRAALGRTEPWLPAFRRIHLELGNEMWNQSFRPLAFGLGLADLYGRFARRQFGLLRSHALFDDGKFDLILSGFIANASNFNGKAAAASAGSADRIGLATYLRGGWDTADILTEDPDDTVSRTTLVNQLLYFERLAWPNYSRFLDTARAHNLGTAVYEGGPGYDLPAPGKEQDPRDELVGKSLALAVTTLDAFMTAQAAGFDPQCFFTFKPGTRWSTHADTALTIPHTAWLALQLRNLHCRGDLVEVRTVRTPLIDLPEIRVGSRVNDGRFREQVLPPLTGAHGVKAWAFIDGPRVSVLLLSRLLEQTTTVTLRLPFPPRYEGTITSLTAADPLASNTGSHQVPLSTAPFEFTGKDVTFNLPPHSAVVLQATAR